MTTCDKSVEITAYLKGEGAPEEREGLRLHFEKCAACGKELGRFDRVLQALGKMEELDPSPGFKWRVREAFLRSHPEFLEPPKLTAAPTFWETVKNSFGYVPAWAMSLAAHVILLAIAAILIFTPKDPEDVMRDQAVQAKPRKPSEDAPDFGGGGKGARPDKVGHVTAVEPGTEDFSPGPRTGAGDAVIRAPKIVRNPDLAKLDRDLWRERIPRDRRLLAYFEARGRDPQQAQMREAYGGQGTEKAVRAALEWLARQQQPNGSWAGPAVKSDTGGESTYSVGLTGLSLLAFLAEGHSGKSGDFAQTVRKGLDFLVAEQKASGLIGKDQGNYMYNHAIAGIALIEGSIVTRDDAFATAASMAVNFTVQAQNEAGGWGYTSRSIDSDTSVAGWQILLLRLAKLNGNQGVITSLVQANSLLRSMTDSEGKVGYRGRMQYPNGYLALTAVGMFAHQLSTHTPDPGLLERQAAVLLERSPLPGTDPFQYGMNDLYFAFFGSLAMHQMGGEAWTQWWSPLKEKLLKSQAPDGSWPANFDRWWAYGGQVYTTAISALILDTPVRYPRLFE